MRVLISPNPGWQLRLPGCHSSSLCHFLIRIIFFAVATGALISDPAGAGARRPPDTSAEALFFTGCEQKPGRPSANKKGGSGSDRRAGSEERVGLELQMPHPPSWGGGGVRLSSSPWRWPGQTSLAKPRFSARRKNLGEGERDPVS